MEPPSEETRDWAALPHDILLAVFLRLGPCEVMQGAELVCTTWRRVAVDEPALWRRVDMGTAPLRSAVVEDKAVRAAVSRGAGQCEAFWGRCDLTLLVFPVKRAPSLKSLHLLSFDGPNEMLSMALKDLPLLEDLEISPSRADTFENLFESVCKTCPLLRTLTVNFTNVKFPCDNYHGSNKISSVIVVEGEIPTMSELRSLNLLDCYLTAEGLMAILDHCPLLESLHITGSFDGKLDAGLKAKCARVKNLTLSVDDDNPMEYYDYLDDFEDLNYSEGFYEDYGYQGPWD